MGCGVSSQADPQPLEKNPQVEPWKAPVLNKSHLTEQYRGTENSDNFDALSFPSGENEKKKFETPQTKEFKNYKKKLRKKFLEAVKLGSSKSILHGNNTAEVKPSYKTVRLFTSSTFTDTKQERNALMIQSYPKLKEYCQELGYDFQVVDMRWGIREEADDKHTTTEICIKEIEQCKLVSTGPSFVTFLSHKYGYRPLPRTIPEQDMEKIIEHLSYEDKSVIEKAYRKDENSIPPVYILLPVSALFSEVQSRDPDVSQSAWTHWMQDIHNVTQDILIRNSRKYAPEKTHEYEMSVTEREIQAGIYAAASPASTAAWFKRTFPNIEKVEYSKKLTRYYECTEDEKDVIARSLMSKLTQELPKKLPEENIVNYEITWDEKEE